MSGPQSGWLRGIVKEVPSGDTVVVMAATKGGIPPEKRLTLSSLVAPKLGRRDGSTRDEPGAWDSREFLRTFAAGKPCVFRVDYALDAAGGREFGTVFVGDKQNIALASVAAGWAKVRPSGGQQSPFYEELAAAAAEAEAKGLGLNAKDADFTVRETGEEFDAADFLQRHGKGKPVSAIVEGVGSGASLRVTLLPGLESAQVLIVGVQCPSMGRKPAAAAAPTGDGAEAAKPAAAGTLAATLAAGGGGGAEGGPEPFAREARHFTELRTLNREVTLLPVGVSQHGVLVASLLYPPTPGATENTADLGSDLLRAGLGRAAEWGLSMMTTGSFKLREAERAARQVRAGQWHSHVPQPGASAKASDKFTGTVVEVVSGDCLVVKDAASGAERRVMLSSIRAPRGAARDRAAEPWAAEAKEFLRQRLIGKEVAVSMEYTRKVPAMGPGTEERSLAFGTVTIEEKAGNEVKTNNVAELLLVRGLVQCVRHRGDEERSAAYEALVGAEEAGKRGKKGQWSSKEPPAPRVNDVTAPGSAARARQHLPFLQRAGKLSGIVEYVLGGSRLKIHVPKEGVTLAFSPSGVRCPGRDEPLAAEALAFTRATALQRDVELEVASVDKAGTFLGTLRIPGAAAGGRALNLGVALLEAGLARLHPSFDGERVELDAAQTKAQAARRGIWEKEDPAAAKAATADTDADGADAAAGVTSSGGSRNIVEVTVTDVADAASFYVQMAAEGRAAWVAEQLAGLSLDAGAPPQGLLKTGDTCLAKFSADGLWYRAAIEKVHRADPTAPQYDVRYLDYGNTDRVAGSAVRPAPPDLAAVAPQAHAATLAFVKAPGLDEEYGVEAAQALSEMVGGGRKLRAVIEGRERPGGAPAPRGWGAAAAAAPAPAGGTKLLLTLLLGEEGEDYADTVNARLVESGLARAAEPRRGRPAPAGPAGEVLAAVRAAQDAARRAHAGIFEYGDPGSDSDDDNAFPSLKGGAAKKR